MNDTTNIKSVPDAAFFLNAMQGEGNGNSIDELVARFADKMRARMHEYSSSGSTDELVDDSPTDISARLLRNAAGVVSQAHGLSSDDTDPSQFVDVANLAMIAEFVTFPSESDTGEDGDED